MRSQAAVTQDERTQPLCCAARSGLAQPVSGRASTDSARDPIQYHDSMKILTADDNRILTNLLANLLAEQLRVRGHAVVTIGPYPLDQRTDRRLR